MTRLTTYIAKLRSHAIRLSKRKAEPKRYFIAQFLFANQADTSLRYLIRYSLYSLR